MSGYMFRPHRAIFRQQLQGRRINRVRNQCESRWQEEHYIPEDSTLQVILTYCISELTFSLIEIISYYGAESVLYFMRILTAFRNVKGYP
jgi:hypothetical protein